MDPTDLLSLPTDNLYKFMAISGLVILIISLIFPFYFKKKFTFRIYEIRKNHNINMIKKEGIERKVSKLEDGLKQVRSQADLDEISESSEQIVSEQNQLSFILEDTDCELKKIEYLSDSVKFLNGFSVIGTLSGLVLTSFGFYLWYIKLQSFLDKALINGVTS